MNIIGKKTKNGGLVVGVITADLQKLQQGQRFKEIETKFGSIIDRELAIKSKNKAWGENWEKELIVYVAFEDPVYVCSFEEFVEFYDYIKKDRLEEMYPKIVQKAYVLSMPLSKVEFEENENE